MKRLNRLVSSLVLVCFIVNTALSDYAFALSPMPGSANPDTRSAMLAAGQKLFGALKGPGSIDWEGAEYKFLGEIPAVPGVKFVEPHGLPAGWQNNALLSSDTRSIVEALKAFLWDDAKLDRREIDVVERYYEVEKANEGELPLCRWERTGKGSVYFDKWTLVVHPDLAAIWRDLKENDVYFEYTFPDGKVRTVSLAWAVFYRIAKHEMTDLVKPKEVDALHNFTPKGAGRGHLTGKFHLYNAGDLYHYMGEDINENERVANEISGRYAQINDAVWMWFLGSYCFKKTTQYNNDTLKSRLLWFFGLYQGEDDAEMNRWAVEHNLPDEFPNLHDAKARAEAIALAQAVNYEFYSKYRSALKPVTAEERERQKREYADRKGRISQVMPATGKDAGSPRSEIGTQAPENKTLGVPPAATSAATAPIEAGKGMIAFKGSEWSTGGLAYAINRIWDGMSADNVLSAGPVELLKEGVGGGAAMHAFYVEALARVMAKELRGLKVIRAAKDVLDPGLAFDYEIVRLRLSYPALVATLFSRGYREDKAAEIRRWLVTVSRQLAAQNDWFSGQLKPLATNPSAEPRDGRALQGSAQINPAPEAPDGRAPQFRSRGTERSGVSEKRPDQRGAQAKPIEQNVEARKVPADAAAAIRAHFMALKAGLPGAIGGVRSGKDHMVWESHWDDAPTRNSICLERGALMVGHYYDIYDARHKRISLAFRKDGTEVTWDDDFAERAGGREGRTYRFIYKGPYPIRYFMVDASRELCAVADPEFVKAYEAQARKVERMGLYIAPMLHFKAYHRGKAPRGFTVIGDTAGVAGSEKPRATVIGTLRTAAAGLGLGVIAGMALGLPDAMLVLAGAASILGVHAAVENAINNLGAIIPKGLIEDDSEIAGYSDFRTWLVDMEQAFAKGLTSRLFALITHESGHIVTKREPFAYAWQLGVTTAIISFIHYTCGMGATAGAAIVAMGAFHYQRKSIYRDYFADALAEKFNSDDMAALVKLYRSPWASMPTGSGATDISYDALMARLRSILEQKGIRNPRTTMSMLVDLNPIGGRKTLEMALDIIRIREEASRIFHKSHRTTIAKPVEQNTATEGPGARTIKKTVEGVPAEDGVTYIVSLMDAGKFAEVIDSIVKDVDTIETMSRPGVIIDRHSQGSMIRAGERLQQKVAAILARPAGEICKLLCSEAYRKLSAAMREKIASYGMSRTDFVEEMMNKGGNEAQLQIYHILPDVFEDNDEASASIIRNHANYEQFASHVARALTILAEWDMRESARYNGIFEYLDTFLARPAAQIAGSAGARSIYFSFTAAAYPYRNIDVWFSLVQGTISTDDAIEAISRYLNRFAGNMEVITSVRQPDDIVEIDGVVYRFAVAREGDNYNFSIKNRAPSPTGVSVIEGSMVVGPLSRWRPVFTDAKGRAVDPRKPIEQNVEGAVIRPEPASSDPVRALESAVKAGEWNSVLTLAEELIRLIETGALDYGSLPIIRAALEAKRSAMDEATATQQHNRMSFPEERLKRLEGLAEAARAEALRIATMAPVTAKELTRVSKEALLREEALDDLGRIVVRADYKVINDTLAALYEELSDAKHQALKDGGVEKMPELNRFTVVRMMLLEELGDARAREQKAAAFARARKPSAANLESRPRPEVTAESVPSLIAKDEDGCRIILELLKDMARSNSFNKGVLAAIVDSTYLPVFNDFFAVESGLETSDEERRLLRMIDEALGAAGRTQEGTVKEERELVADVAPVTDEDAVAGALEVERSRSGSLEDAGAGLADYMEIAAERLRDAGLTGDYLKERAEGYLENKVVPHADRAVEKILQECIASSGFSSPSSNIGSWLLYVAVIVDSLNGVESEVGRIKISKLLVSNERIEFYTYLQGPDNPAANAPETIMENVIALDSRNIILRATDAQIAGLIDSRVITARFISKGNEVYEIRCAPYYNIKGRNVFVVSESDFTLMSALAGALLPRSISGARHFVAFVLPYSEINRIYRPRGVRPKIIEQNAEGIWRSQVRVPEGATRRMLRKVGELTRTMRLGGEEGYAALATLRIIARNNQRTAVGARAYLAILAYGEDPTYIADRLAGLSSIFAGSRLGREIAVAIAKHRSTPKAIEQNAEGEGPETLSSAPESEGFLTLLPVILMEPGMRGHIKFSFQYDPSEEFKGNILPASHFEFRDVTGQRVLVAVGVSDSGLEGLVLIKGRYYSVVDMLPPDAQSIAQSIDEHKFLGIGRGAWEKLYRQEDGKDLGIHRIMKVGDLREEGRVVDISIMGRRLALDYESMKTEAFAFLSEWSRVAREIYEKHKKIHDSKVPYAGPLLTDQEYTQTSAERIETLGMALSEISLFGLGVRALGDEAFKAEFSPQARREIVAFAKHVWDFRADEGYLRSREENASAALRMRKFREHYFIASPSLLNLNRSETKDEARHTFIFLAVNREGKLEPVIALITKPIGPIPADIVVTVPSHLRKEAVEMLLKSLPEKSCIERELWTAYGIQEGLFPAPEAPEEVVVAPKPVEQNAEALLRPASVSPSLSRVVFVEQYNGKDSPIFTFHYDPAAEFRGKVVLFSDLKFKDNTGRELKVAVGLSEAGYTPLIRVGDRYHEIVDMLPDEADSIDYYADKHKLFRIGVSAWRLLYEQERSREIGIRKIVKVERTIKRGEGADLNIMGRRFRLDLAEMKKGMAAFFDERRRGREEIESRYRTYSYTSHDMVVPYDKAVECKAEVTRSLGKNHYEISLDDLGVGLAGDDAFNAEFTLRARKEIKRFADGIGQGRDRDYGNDREDNATSAIYFGESVRPSVYVAPFSDLRLARYDSTSEERNTFIFLAVNRDGRLTPVVVVAVATLPKAGLADVMVTVPTGFGKDAVEMLLRGLPEKSCIERELWTAYGIQEGFFPAPKAVAEEVVAAPKPTELNAAGKMPDASPRRDDGAAKPAEAIATLHALSENHSFVVQAARLALQYFSKTEGFVIEDLLKQVKSIDLQEHPLASGLDTIIGRTLQSWIETGRIARTIVYKESDQQWRNLRRDVANTMYLMHRLSASLGGLPDDRLVTDMLYAAAAMTSPFHSQVTRHIKVTGEMLRRVSPSAEPRDGRAFQRNAQINPSAEPRDGRAFQRNAQISPSAEPRDGRTFQRKVQTKPGELNLEAGDSGAIDHKVADGRIGYSAERSYEARIARLDRIRVRVQRLHDDTVLYIEGLEPDQKEAMPFLSLSTAELADKLRGIFEVGSDQIDLVDVDRIRLGQTVFNAGDARRFTEAIEAYRLGLLAELRFQVKAGGFLSLDWQKYLLVKEAIGTNGKFYVPQSLDEAIWRAYKEENVAQLLGERVAAAANVIAASVTLRGARDSMSRRGFFALDEQKYRLVKKAIDNRVKASVPPTLEEAIWRAYKEENIAQLLGERAVAAANPAPEAPDDRASQGEAQINPSPEAPDGRTIRKIVQAKPWETSVAADAEAVKGYIASGAVTELRDEVEPWLSEMRRDYIEKTNYTTPERFRELTYYVGSALADKVSKMPGLEDAVVVLPWRAALGLATPFRQFFGRFAHLGVYRDEVTKEPHEYYSNLKEVESNKDGKFVVADPMLATGGSFLYAIKRLIDIGVKEENITVVSVLSAPYGIVQILKNYPKVKIVACQIDERLDGNAYIVPGLGDFGDRYFEGIPDEELIDLVEQGVMSYKDYTALRKRMAYLTADAEGKAASTAKVPVKPVEQNVAGEMPGAESARGWSITAEQLASFLWRNQYSYKVLEAALSEITDFDLIDRAKYIAVNEHKGRHLEFLGAVNIRLMRLYDEQHLADRVRQETAAGPAPSVDVYESPEAEAERLREITMAAAVRLKYVRGKVAAGVAVDERILARLAKDLEGGYLAGMEANARAAILRAEAINVAIGEKPVELNAEGAPEMSSVTLEAMNKLPVHISGRELHRFDNFSGVAWEKSAAAEDVFTQTQLGMMVLGLDAGEIPQSIEVTDYYVSDDTDPNFKPQDVELKPSSAHLKVMLTSGSAVEMGELEARYNEHVDYRTIPIFRGAVSGKSEPRASTSGVSPEALAQAILALSKDESELARSKPSTHQELSAKEEALAQKARAIQAMIDAVKSEADLRGLLDAISPKETNRVDPSGAVDEGKIIKLRAETDWQLPIRMRIGKILDKKYSGEIGNPAPDGRESQFRSRGTERSGVSEKRPDQRGAQANPSAEPRDDRALQGSAQINPSPEARDVRTIRRIVQDKPVEQNVEGNKPANRAEDVYDKTLAAFRVARTGVEAAPVVKPLTEVISEYFAPVARHQGPGRTEPTPTEIGSFYPVYELIDTATIEIYLPQALRSSITDDVNNEISRLNMRIIERTGRKDKAIYIKAYDATGIEDILSAKRDGVRRIFVNDISTTALFRSLSAPDKAHLLKGNRLITTHVPQGKDRKESSVRQAWLVKTSILSAIVEEGNIPTVGEALKAELAGRLTTGIEAADFVARLINTDGENDGAVAGRVNYFLGAIVKLSEFAGEQIRILKAFWTAA